MSDSKFLVGIDLGTSNCAAAFVEPERGAEAPVLDLPIPQLIRPGETANAALLPSCVYLPGSELAPEATRLPWSHDSGAVVGELARWQGTQVPGRLVTSAKSWLCHPGIDRWAPILPWGAPPEVPRVSPVEASALLLQHMAQAWNFSRPDSPLAEQELVITVPASFDEAARALTVSAIQRAGFKQFSLLEEPQAAFYDFIAHHRTDLDQCLRDVRLVLVVDVGGGTSDFTLVQVSVLPEGPVLKRIAVGEHLMLGGDNMDAALGRKAEEKLVAHGRRLSTSQWIQLTAAARIAKERLLSGTPGGPEARYYLSLAAEGSKLLGRTLSTSLTHSEVAQIILDGFFPQTQPEERPSASARLALQELGLPYVQDPAVTRHLTAFLRAHAPAGFAALGLPPDTAGLPRPDALLLNGGVFNSPEIATRLTEAISGWWPNSPPVSLLKHDSLDLAVARGAAYYGLVRRGFGRRIGGGAAHALYVGLDKAGAENAPRALCVIPRGQEEGETVDLGQRVFRLGLGKPVQFPLFSTAADRLDRSGDVVPITEELQPLPPIHTLLKSGTQKTGSVPVHLRATLTEIGTLELWCISNSGNERWRLEFELRGSETQRAFAVTESMPAAFAEARRCIEHIFGGRRSAPGATGRGTLPKDVKQLWPSLERALGPREEWSVPLLRELWSAVYAGSNRRRRSADHERVFFQLLGYSLRPGFGYPLDEWRAEESARLFPESVQFHKEKPGWKEFWTMWRRISGGLGEQRQEEIWKWLKPHLAARVPPTAQKNVNRPKGPPPEGLDEMVRLAANLEHLAPADKTLLGTWLLERLKNPTMASGPWTWALGRLGARTLIYGSVHKTLPPQTATEWVERLLEPGTLRLEGTLFALTQLARLTGDRSRDLAPELRNRVLSALQAADASPSWQRLLREVVAFEAADKARALGDSLPVGLSLE